MPYFFTGIILKNKEIINRRRDKSEKERKKNFLALLTLSSFILPLSQRS
jgi:hypothetical protein